MYIKLKTYLNYLNEQQFGINPPQPVQNPEPSRPTKFKQPKQPSQPKVPQAKGVNPKAYFNYMVWTTKILKQGEIFRRNCYNDNCSEFQIGTGKRRICKDRCDVEACKKVIQLLNASISKCNNSVDPDKCRQRYMTLIPLYQNKLRKISSKFIQKTKAVPVYNKKNVIKVG